VDNQDPAEPLSPLEALRAQLYEWEQLKAHGGYRRLDAYARAQIEHRLSSLVLGETREMVDIIRREYARGEIAGIQLFSRMADIEIERLREDIAQLVEQIESTGGNEHVQTTTESAP